MYQILIFGDRNWTNLQLIVDTLRSHMHKHNLLPEDVVVIEGEANGADKLGAIAAHECGVKQIRKFPANWVKYGRAAGPIRNTQMIEENELNYGLGFHNNIRDSKGTADMARQLHDHQIPHEIIKE